MNNIYQFPSRKTNKVVKLPIKQRSYRPQEGQTRLGKILSSKELLKELKQNLNDKGWFYE